jgi:hypothetical protein
MPSSAATSTPARSALEPPGCCWHGPTHSAQLGRAERELRTIVAENPADAYAHLLLGRTLQRQSRHDEAGTHLRLAAAMGLTP